MGNMNTLHLLTYIILNTVPVIKSIRLTLIDYHVRLDYSPTYFHMKTPSKRFEVCCDSQISYMCVADRYVHYRVYIIDQSSQIFE